MTTPEMLPGRMSRYVRVVGTCWVWTGAVQSRGYGSTANGKGGSMLAHRCAYEALVGPIPAGLTLDHLCRNKLCVNPEHLEPVTVAVNVRRAKLGFAPNFGADDPTPALLRFLATEGRAA